jgi:predicted MFS family arabinose efflux permease
MSRPLPPTAAFAGVAAVFAAFFLAAGAPTPLLSLRQQEWGFSAGMLTIAFAAYALALLAAVLVGGSLSDHVGRRPILLAALGVELVAMVLFLLAPTIAWVVVARVVQGAATGLGTSAFSAAVVEHAPDHLKRLGSTFASTAVAAGLGIGALLTGAAVQFTPDANALTFGVLIAVMAIGLVVVSLTRETVERRPGALRSLDPRIVLPAGLRREFLAGIPAYAPGWMLGAFFLGLSPVVLRVRFGLDGGLVAGFTAFLGPIAAALATLAFARVGARRTTLSGAALALVGAVLVVAGVRAEWRPVLWLGEVFGGAGFGAAFGGHLRVLGPRIRPHERAGVFAGVYTVAYLALGVPAIVAGQLSSRIGLLPTVEGYAALVLGTATVGVVVQLVLARADRAPLAALVNEPAPAPAPIGKAA